MKPLHEQRLDAVAAGILQSGARIVLDLGCGTGRLLSRLSRMPQFEKLIGMDSSAAALAAARARLLAAGDPRFILMHGSFTEGLGHLRGVDAAALVEAIEHVPPSHLSALEAELFGACRPASVFITTPNHEHNRLYGKPDGVFRHPGHHFEWSRAKFERWCASIARRRNYRVTIAGIGAPNPVFGCVTQMARFERLPAANGLMKPPEVRCRTTFGRT